MSARNALSNNTCFLPLSSCFIISQKHFPCTVANHALEKGKNCAVSWRINFYLLERERKKKIIIFQQLNLSRTNILVALVRGWVQSPAGLKNITCRSILFQSMFRSFSPFLTPQPCFVISLFSRTFTSAWSHQLKIMALFSSYIHFAQQNDSELLAVRSKRSFTMHLSCLACNKLTATSEG